MLAPKIPYFFKLKPLRNCQGGKSAVQGAVEQLFCAFWDVRHDFRHVCPNSWSNFTKPLAICSPEMQGLFCRRPWVPWVPWVGRLRLRPEELKPQEVTKILMADARLKQWEQACYRLFQWMQWMPETRLFPSPNLYHYNAVMSACQKAAAWESSLKVLEVMQLHGPAPDVVSYNITLSSCEKVGQWQWAVWLLHTMPLLKVRPDSISFSTAMSSCEAFGRPVSK